MYTTARLSMLIGAGLLTAMVGAGPAQAAGQQPQPPQHQTTTVGYFRTLSDCDWVGQTGDMQNRWNNPDCNQVNDGMFRGMWRLDVDRYGSMGWPGPGNGNGNGNGHGNGNGNGHGNGNGNGNGNGHGPGGPGGHH